jgi:SlyX protein
MSDEIIDLQTKLAFQESLLDEFNTILTSQQAQITQLESTVEMLKAQVKSLQAVMPADSNQQQHEIPPHY